MVNNVRPHAKVKQDREEYEAYLAFIEANPDLGLPVPKDIDDYFTNRDAWAEKYSDGGGGEGGDEDGIEPPQTPTAPVEPAKPGYHWVKVPGAVVDYNEETGELLYGGVAPVPDYNYIEVPRHLDYNWDTEKLYKSDFSDEDVREYYTFRDYASAYAEPGEWFPIDIEDYFNKWDVAQEQLQQYLDIQETALREHPERTADEVREYYNYRNYASAYRKLGDWQAVDIDDYFKNHDIAAQQLTEWQQLQADDESSQREFNANEIRDYKTFQRYASAYGEIDDWYPTDINDFYANFDKAQEALAKFKAAEQQAETDNPERSADEIRDYYSFRNYAQAYGELEDWFPVDINDYFNNQAIAQELLTKYQTKYTEQKAQDVEYSADDIREYNTFRQYASAYGEAGDWYPTDIKDYYTNWNTAQEQLQVYKDLQTEAQAENPDRTNDEIREYYIYRNYASAYKELGDWFPVDIEDYFANLATAQAQLVVWQSKEAQEQAENVDYTNEQIREYNTYRQYASAFGQPGEWYPVDIGDYFDNHTTAVGQLDKYKADQTEALAENPDRTKDEIRDYYTFRNYASAYGEPGDWFATDIEDYYANIGRAQEELGKWQTRQAEWEAKEAEAERKAEESYEYTQWAREQSQYAAQEAYQPSARYEPGFEQWFGSQEARSQPLQDWMRSMFPSLREQYEATLPAQVGYPTREEARARETQIEAGWQKFLKKETPELEEQWYLKRPGARGERPAAFAPRLRTVSF